MYPLLVRMPHVHRAAGAKLRGYMHAASLGKRLYEVGQGTVKLYAVDNGGCAQETLTAHVPVTLLGSRPANCEAVCCRYWTYGCSQETLTAHVPVAHGSAHIYRGRGGVPTFSELPDPLPPRPTTN